MTPEWRWAIANRPNAVRQQVKLVGMGSVLEAMKPLVIVPDNPWVFWDQPVPDPSLTRTLVKGMGFPGFGYRFAWVAWVCKPAQVRVTGMQQMATDYGYLKTSATALGWYPNHWEACPPHW